MAWIKISDEDGGTYAREVENPQDVVTKAELQSQLATFQSKLDEILGDFVHADKDYEAFVNYDREKRRQIISERMFQIDSILKELV